MPLASAHYARAEQTLRTAAGRAAGAASAPLAAPADPLALDFPPLREEDRP